MMRRVCRGSMAALAAAVLLAGCGGALTDASGDLALFPEAKAPLTADGPPKVLTLGGSDTVEVTAWRFTPLPGLSQAATTKWCGVVLHADASESQALVTIGVSFTEALSCRGLADIGVVPAKGAAARIGLLYRTASPNAEVVTPVVLMRDPASSTWSVDATASQRLTRSRQVPTLATMRRDLRAE